MFMLCSIKTFSSLLCCLLYRINLNLIERQVKLYFNSIFLSFEGFNRELPVLKFRTNRRIQRTFTGASTSFPELESFQSQYICVHEVCNPK